MHLAFFIHFEERLHGACDAGRVTFAVSAPMKSYNGTFRRAFAWRVRCGQGHVRGKRPNEVLQRAPMKSYNGDVLEQDPVCLNGRDAS